MHRYHWLLAMSALLVGVWLTAIACDGSGGDEIETGPAVGVELPSPEQGATVPEGAEIVFEGQRYQVVTVAPTDTVDKEIAEFEEVGVAEDSTVETEGDITVYRRDDDEEAIYTGPLIPAEGGGETELRYRWIPVDALEESGEPSVNPNEGEFQP